MGTALGNSATGIATQTQRGVTSGNEMMGLLFGSGNPAQNHLANGSFDFDQRGAVITTDGSYGADRWFLSHNVTSGSMARGNPGDGTVSGFVNSLTLTTRGAGTGIEMTQPMEAAQVYPLAGRQVTLTFRVKRNATMSSGQVYFGAAFGTTENQKFPSGAGSSSTIVESSIIPTSGYVALSYTFTVPSGAKSMRVFIGMSGTPWPNGSVLSVGDCMLNIGSVAQPFARAGGSIQQELALCQRYYFKDAASGSTKYFGVISNGISATRQIGVFTVPVPMRAFPTPSVSGCNFYALSGSTPYAVSAVVMYSLIKESNNLSVDFTVASHTHTNPHIFSISESGYIAFDAEL